MSTIIGSAASGRRVTAGWQSDPSSDRVRGFGSGWAPWLCGLLLLGVGWLGLLGTEPREVFQSLAAFESSDNTAVSIASDSVAWSSGLPQIDGQVRRPPALASPVRVPPVLGGHSLGQSAESRAVRKSVAVSLSPEQAQLARYIATEYQRALEFSREMVHHAYQVAREAQVDPLLVLAIVSVESRFNPLAESPAGAQGLMQVLTRVHFAKFRPFGGIQAAFDPVANLKVGTAILRHYLQSHDTVTLALKAYVGAAQADHDFGYGAKVMAARARLVDAAGLPTDAAAQTVSVRMVPALERLQAIDPQGDI